MYISEDIFNSHRVAALANKEGHFSIHACESLAAVEKTVKLSGMRKVVNTFKSYGVR